MSTKLVLCLIATALIANGVQGRSMLQAASAPSGSSNLKIPVNRAAVEAAEVALEESELVLSQAGSVDEAGIQNVTLTGGHGAAEEAFGTAGAGQSSAVHAGIASAAAALLSAGGALTNNESVITQARAAIATAKDLIAAVTDQEILSVTETEFADLAILATLGHDGTLVHYWQNITTGDADNETFAEWVESSAAIYEAVEEQLEEGASSTVAVLAAQAIAHNLIGAINNFQGNSEAVAQANIDIALIMLKAIRFKQTGATCSATWETADPPIEKAIEDAETASTALTPESLTTALTSAQAVLTTVQCPELAASLAPAAAVSSAGRK